MKKTIYIVGVGGRTGAMFCRELQAAAYVIGVGMDREIEAINNEKIKVRRGANQPEILKTEIVQSGNFAGSIDINYPDFIWMATRNPVTEAVKFYYRNFKGKRTIPALILSQNGLSAINDARTGLFEVLGQAADSVQIIRVSLINGVDRPAAEIARLGQHVPASHSDSEAIIYEYKLPIKLGFGAVGGQSAADLKEIFNIGKFKCQEFRGNNVVDMENSKLFTNLIGMAAAVNGMDAGQGLRDKKVFKEEVAALKEFVLAVKKSGSGFVDDLCGYPIKFLAGLMLWPAWLLMPWRGLLANIVAKGRNRPKDLSEIDYYNGEAVKLGKKFNVATPANEAIAAKAREINKR